MSNFKNINEVDIESGESYSDYTVSGTGSASNQIDVMSGGSVNNLIVASGGIILLENGASANSIDVQSGGEIEIANGATVSGLVTIDGATVLKGGYYQDSNSTYYQDESTKAPVIENETDLGSGSLKKINELDIGSGDLYFNNTISGTGSASTQYDVMSGGSIDNVIVGSGGIVLLENGASARNIDVQSGGEVEIANGATVSGLVTINGATVLKGGHYQDSNLSYYQDESTKAPVVENETDLGSGSLEKFNIMTTADQSNLFRGTITNNTPQDGQQLYIFGKTAEIENLTVGPNITVLLEDGSQTNGITLEAGATLEITPGASVQNVNQGAEAKVLTGDKFQDSNISFYKSSVTDTTKSTTQSLLAGVSKNQVLSDFAKSAGIEKTVLGSQKGSSTDPWSALNNKQTHAMGSFNIDEKSHSINIAPTSDHHSIALFS